MSFARARADVERALRAPITDREWAYLKYDGTVGDLDGGSDLVEVARKVKQLRRAYGPDRVTDLGERGKRKSPSSANRRVVASICRWRDARTDQELQRFRREVMGGAPLSPDEVAKRWPEILREGEWKAANAVANAVALAEWAQKQGGITKLMSGPDGRTPEKFHAAFLMDTNPSALPARWLQRISQRLAFEHGWTSDEAMLVIICDSCPVPPAVRSKVLAPAGTTARLRLEIDPSATPQEVVSAFQKARTKMVGHRYRPLSDRHLDLALLTYALVRQQPKGAPHLAGSLFTWGLAFTKWNGRFPKWAYTTRSNFRRDALSSYAALIERRFHPVDEEDIIVIPIDDDTRARIGE